MNKFVTAALATAAVGSVGWSDPGDSDWLELDSEINSLASSLSSSQDGMGWAALLRITYTYSEADVATDNGNDDNVSGFKFEDVDLAFWGAVGEYGYRVSMDIDPDGSEGGSDVDFTMEDAYAYWECGEYFTAMFGQFKPHFLRSGFIDPENQLFIDRTALGSTYDMWDTGVGTHGTWESFGWYTQVFNGVDGQESGHYYGARVEWNYGEGAGAAEGALGGNDELNGTVGFFTSNDDAQGGSLDNQNFGGDVWGNFGQIGFGAEFVSLDDDSFSSLGSDFSRTDANLLFIGDSTPWNVTFSWLINPEWEVGVRYEDLDNDGNSLINPNGDVTITSAVVNWYRSGRNAKWQGQVQSWDGDNAASGTVVQIGLVVGASR